jgi:transposase
LEGSYFITTDAPREVTDKEVIHDSYKDLAQVEQDFRMRKSAHLGVRPVHVRTEAHTRSHVLVVMLAYLVRRAFSEAWSSLDLTVEEGLESLKTICSMEINIEG